MNYAAVDAASVPAADAAISIFSAAVVLAITRGILVVFILIPSRCSLRRGMRGRGEGVLSTADGIGQGVQPSALTAAAVAAAIEGVAAAVTVGLALATAVIPAAAATTLGSPPATVVIPATAAILISSQS